MIYMDGYKSLSRAEKLLAGIPDGINKAVKNAMPRAVSHLRTQSTAAVRERYDVSAENIRANENVMIRFSYGGGSFMVAEVVFSGSLIPLFRYGGASPKSPTFSGHKVNAMLNGNWRKVRPGIAASGHQLRASAPTTFSSAFVARMNSGHTGIFERVGENNKPLRELMGSSVPQMLGDNGVQERLVSKTEEKFNERIEHEITRLLNGW